MTNERGKRRGKGIPPPRRCPEDFDVIFVEVGRHDCESWYRASRITVDRWLKERGKSRLVAKRAAFVAHQRATGNWLTRSSRLVSERPRVTASRKPVRDRRKVNLALARRAAQFLRIIRNGGWIVSQAPEGDWRVGSKRLSAAQMLDFAVARGFEVGRANLQIEAEERVGRDHG